MALVLVATACGTDLLGSSETERLGAEVERLEAEVDDLRDRLQQGGLVEPTVTLGADPPQSDELIGFVKGGEIFVMDPYGRDVRQVTDHPNDPYVLPHWSLPRWSPDGSQIVYMLLGSGDLRIINTDGTNGRRLIDDQSCGMATVASWSPDGEHVLFTCGASDIYVVNGDGTGLRQLTHKIDDGVDRVENMDGSWSPDGQYISYREQSFPFMEAWTESIVFISFPEGEEVNRSSPFPIVGTVFQGFPVTWGPLYSHCDSPCDQYPIAYRASKDGESIQVFTEYFHPEWSQMLVGSGHEPWFVQRTDSKVRQDTPVWTSDGRFAYVNETVDGPEIFSDSPGYIPPRPRQLTNNLFRDGNPVWSPDGKKIAHTSNRDGPSGIHVMDAGDTCYVESRSNAPCDYGGGNILSTGQSGIPWGWISTG